MKKSENFSIGNRFKSFTHAFNGIISVIRYEHNSRIQLAIAILAVVLGFLFNIERQEWMIIIVLSGFVFLSELFNTAIERLADAVSPEWDDKIGLIKDCSAGAVLVSSITALLIGGLIFIPKIAWFLNAVSAAE